MGIMKSPLQMKLQTLAAGSGGGSSKARYGPVAEEIQVSVSKSTSRLKLMYTSKDMASAVFTMNKALQDKMKELQNGHTSGHVAGLRELAVSRFTHRSRFAG